MFVLSFADHVQDNLHDIRQLYFFYFCMFVLSFAEMFLLSFADKVMFVLSFADKFIFCADICKKKKKKKKKRKKDNFRIHFIC